jgi:hypothetical protein
VDAHSTKEIKMLDTKTLTKETIKTCRESKKWLSYIRDEYNFFGAVIEEKMSSSPNRVPCAPGNRGPGGLS